MSELTYHLKDFGAVSSYDMLKDQLEGEEELSLMFHFHHSSLNTQRHFLFSMLKEQYGGKKITPPPYFAIDTENQSRMRSFTPKEVAEYLRLTATEDEIRQNILDNRNGTTIPLLRPLAAFDVVKKRPNPLRFWGLKTMAYSSTGNDYFMNNIGPDSAESSNMTFLPQQLPLEEYIANLYTERDTKVFTHLYAFPDKLSEQERTFYREGTIKNMFNGGSEILATCYTFRSSFGLPHERLQFKHIVIPTEKLIRHPDYHLFKLFWPIFDWAQIESRVFIPARLPASL